MGGTGGSGSQVDVAVLTVIPAELDAARAVLGLGLREGMPWLVLRGISDFGDNLKDDRFHAFAARAAAAVLVDFIARGLDTVKVLFGVTPVPAVVIEDHGNIGVRGRRLVRVRVKVDDLGNVVEFDYPAEEIKS